MASRIENHRFGDLLRRHRSRIGFTQQELADFSTISVRAIRDLEHGRARHPRKDTVRLLARALRLNERDGADLLAAAGRRTGHSVDLSGPYAAEAPPPVPRTPILGRRNEADALATALASPGRRLVTVTGAPGVGKSRFAVEVARRCHRSGAIPVLWAMGTGHTPFSPCAEHGTGLGELVERAVEDLFSPFGVVDGGHRGLAALSRAVGDRPALLVLDEPRPGAPDPLALARLLRECSEMRVLAVAERPYGEPGEQVFPLAPLSPAAAIDVLLWHLRDTRIAPSPDPEDTACLAEICSLLDRLPGALVCAATWLTLYDPATLLSCLREDPLPFLTPLTGAGVSGPADALNRVATSCTPQEEVVLDLLCADIEGERTDDLARNGGLPIADCGRVLNGLITRGLVRCERGTGRSRVHALNLVRVLRARRVPGGLTVDGPVRIAV